MNQSKPSVRFTLGLLTINFLLCPALFGIRFVKPVALPSRSSEPGFPALRAADRATKERAIEAMTKLPIRFEADSERATPTQFIAHGSNHTLVLHADEAVLAFPQSPTQTALRMKLAGSNPKVHPVGIDPMPHRTHYLTGNDARKWRTNVAQYAKVKYEGVYPGIDLVYYGKEQQLEYDFMVRPGSNPNTISMIFEGAQAARIDESGDLILATNVGEVRQHKPFAYQEVNGTRQPIVCEYQLASQTETFSLANLDNQSLTGQSRNRVRFELGQYNESLPLIIDPVLSYSSYLGGSSNDQSNGIFIDLAGDIYIVGQTGSLDLPTASPLQSDISGNRDAFITKLNSTGTALIYSTYIGGSGDEEGLGITVDAFGQASIVGKTTSTDFPTLTPLQPVFGGGESDAFIAKLNAAGSAFIYSTFFGGKGDDEGRAIALDSFAQVHITGTTTSANFPIANAIQEQLSGAADAFVAKFDQTASLLFYSTLLGGDGAESGNSIALDGNGNTYVTGATDSSNFPTANPLQNSLGGSRDAFVSKLNSVGSFLFYSTYLGGADDDTGNGIALDEDNNAYVVGKTASASFPLSNALQSTYGGNGDGFISKLSKEGNALVYSTFLGGDQDDAVSHIALDPVGNAYVIGETNSPTFPTVKAVQNARSGGFDAFVAKVNTTGNKLLYSTFLGGSNEEFGRGIAVSSADNVFVTGKVESANFPIANPVQARNDGLADAFVSRLSDLRISGAFVSGKKLIVTGENFQLKAKIEINGVAVKTANGDDATHELESKKAVKKMPLGQAVSITIRNPNGQRSEPLTFTRLAQ